MANEIKTTCPNCSAAYAGMDAAIGRARQRYLEALASAKPAVAPLATVQRSTVAAAIDDVFERLAVEAEGYALVAQIGALAMFVSLGSLAALSRVL